MEIHFIHGAKLGLFKFHLLSANVVGGLGESATVRMAHANEKTTKIYTGSNQVVWNEVSAITVRL